MISKKAVSPVVATVLLILIVIILAIIILIWSKGLFGEAISKEILGKEKRIETYCGEVDLNPVINENEFGFENKGNVPLYGYSLKTTAGGDKNTQEFESHYVNPGFIEIIGQDYNSYDKVEVIPILLGKTKSGSDEVFVCSNKYAIQL